MPLDTKTLKVFAGIFQGNSSFFVKHQGPFLKEDGKLKAKYCLFAKYNKHTLPPKGKDIGDLIPVTQEHYSAHLNGGDGLAVSPIMNIEDDSGQIIKRNVCYFGVIDIDVYGVIYTTLIQRLYRVGLRFVAFLSKSGGLHLYFFFYDAEPADRVIATLGRIVEVFGLDKLYTTSKGKSKVEIFPKQASFVPGDSAANCLFLPFYNAYSKEGCLNKMLTSEGKLIGIVKALPIIDSMVTTLKAVNQILDNLPFNDAPFCIQMIALTGALGKNEGRNQYLFAAGIYLKKRYKEDFYERLAEINACLEAPVDVKELRTIYKSITERGYDRYSCEKSPLSDFCDKKLCGAREFGPTRDKNNRFTAVDCWGKIKKVVDDRGELQHYIWELRVESDGEFKDIIMDNEDDLYNQSAVQKRCLRYLNWSPYAIKQNDWITIVNNAMTGIRDKEDESVVVIPKGTSTAESSLLYDSFLKFLVHYQIQSTLAQKVFTGGVFYDGEAYYFTVAGLTKYLQLQKHPNTHKLNLRKHLEEYGCVQGEVQYKTGSGQKKVIPCWKKPDSEEIRTMASVYADIFEGDTIEIEKESSSKTGKGGQSDIKF